MPRRYRDVISAEYIVDEDIEASEDVIQEGPAQVVYRRKRGTPIGAATLLLTLERKVDPDFVVLEGAPGQGKSTITQYVCQAHRMRLLGYHAELERLDASHRAAPIRLPIKVDLRDFATWLSRQNPFSADDELIDRDQWQKSLEAFLSFLISHQAGGIAFDVADLHAIARLGPLLLVLDGLDEVADMSRRTEVVEEIQKGAERLASISHSLKVVVTSRPIAFANSPGLPEPPFRYLSLGAVTPELTDEYAGKWLKARNLGERESAEVKAILRDKLDQPHLRDLARNPMQLAILLSLIHTRGTSLPDKRTALYDSYVELFFNREAEKSPVVRNHRDLLIDIHRFLAWLLHGEAERNSKATGRLSGAMEEGRLKRVLRDYLSSEGRNPELAELLFTGMVERVVAIVSRVQGTYEFEVQPLREYCAARFLYETAPYSPPGNERRGTKPDRFDALSRNFYWLNVARFYAGCYSKGELPSLIDRLSELINDPDYRLISHPRMLAATLLSDWVFSQHPKSVSEVINIILDGLGLRFLLALNSRHFSHNQQLTLASACGRAELVAKCTHILRGFPPPDYASEVIDLLRPNINRGDLLALWLKESQDVTGTERTQWLRYGLQLGCLGIVPENQLETVLSDEDVDRDRIDVLFRARRSDVLCATADRFVMAVKAIVDLATPVNLNWRKQTVLEAFGQAIDARRYAVSFYEAYPGTLRELLKRRLAGGSVDLPKEITGSCGYNDEELCVGLIRIASDLNDIEAARWATDLQPWGTLIEALTDRFGESIAAMQLANLAAGIASSAETCTDAPEMFDSDQSLCRRARYARLRAGTPQWWRTSFDVATTPSRRFLALLVYFTWASPKTIVQTIAQADAATLGLSEREWSTLYDAVHLAVRYTVERSGRRHMDIDIEELPRDLSVRSAVIMRMRSKPLTADRLYDRFVRQYTGEDAKILSSAQSVALHRIANVKAEGEAALAVLARAYRLGLRSLHYPASEFQRSGRLRLDSRLAHKIAEHADQYPTFLVGAAEAQCRAETAEKIRPVAKTAEDERWFVH